MACTCLLEPEGLIDCRGKKPADEAMSLGAVDPLPVVPCPLNADWADAASHLQQLGSSLDWGPANRCCTLSAQH